MSKRKFIVLFAATIGIYQVYWFYENWRLYRDNSDEKIWPVARAIFSIFFVHSLFRILDRKLQGSGHRMYWNARSNATILVVLIIVNSMLGNAINTLSSPYVDFLSVATLVPLAFVYCKAQVVINVCCDDPEGTRNDTLTWQNYSWCALGLASWALSLFGLYLKLHNA